MDLSAGLLRLQAKIRLSSFVNYPQDGCAVRHSVEGGKMPANRTKSVRVGCAVSLLLGLVAGIVFFTRYQATTGCHENHPLLKSMDITMDPSQDGQFIEQARQFAFKNSFRFDTGYFNPQNSDVRIRMLRKDVEIIIRNPFNAGRFEIGFYNYDCIHPTMASDIDDLVIDFKGFLSEIPTALINEK
jgi:hypothetical protein